MARLKSLYEHPPGSFQFLQPETGQRDPFVGSFTYVCDQLTALRLANPFLCERHGWRTDRAGVEHDVEQYNVARCIQAGYYDFLVQDAPGPATYTAAPPPEKKKRQGVVGGVKRVAGGIALLVDWLGSGGKPVEAPLAQARATTCATCPKNDGGDWKAYFTEAVSEKIRVQLEMRNDMQLSTPQDDKLTVCSGCDCPLKLKVWAPLDHVLKHTSDDTKARLDPRCWVLHEK